MEVNRMELSDLESIISRHEEALESESVSGVSDIESQWEIVPDFQDSLESVERHLERYRLCLKLEILQRARSLLVEPGNEAVVIDLLLGLEGVEEDFRRYRVAVQEISEDSVQIGWRIAGVIRERGE